MKNIHSPNLVGIGSWGPEIWPHEYLLSPIEISVNWPGSNSYEPGQLFTLISMGLIRYSCGHILGHHEPIHVKFGAWRCFIMLYQNGHENAEMQTKNVDDVTLRYSIDVIYLSYSIHISPSKLPLPSQDGYLIKGQVLSHNA